MWWKRTARAAMRAFGVDPSFAHEVAPGLFDVYAPLGVGPIEAVEIDQEHWS